ncbi:NAD(P)/FAD-dependent oxidoreductase [Nocardioides sp. Bht2]|uniref:NAD(P)/FAD-dependent oxidoreductase n=1 Tax=Nocardioides sp. Bht2 TaxID=3392297 RepID=UPI0039B556E5
MTGRCPSGADRVVIVGAGHAGVQLAHSLRENQHHGPVVLLGDESELPYHRPPLSKSMLDTSAPAEPTLLRAEASYAARDITVLRQARAARVDRGRRLVELDEGDPVPYDHLVLATGSRARNLSVPGAELPGVVQVRTLSDAMALRSLLSRGSQRVVVVGGGYIGLEIAAAVSSTGHQVVIVEGTERLLARSVAAEVSHHVLRSHTERGCRVELGSAVTAFVGDTHGVQSVELTTGERIPADLVVVGVGGVPNAELAAASGLEICPITGGIVVDERLGTDDPRVSAIGDCATFPSQFAGGPIRLESVQNAVDQARHVAARLTDGPDTAYNNVPWFWTDQGALKIQSTGISLREETRVVVGSPPTGRFSVLRFEGDRLVAVDSVNRPADHLAARRVLAGPRRPSPESARAPGFDLKRFLSSV